MQKETLVNGTKGALKEWHAIQWHKAFRMLKNLRGRIFRAAKEGNYKTLRSLQKLMLRSITNVIISVRRITQVNKGKGTAGIDGVTISSAAARAELINELRKYQPWKAKPARRIYIPKADGKKRPLGIPVIKDRVLQAMIVNALEPEWESKFEISSYGFRPGRGCHDAIEKVFGYSYSNANRRWVIDADIKGAFDNIDHNFLLDAINGFPAKALIKQWLKAGYMERNDWHATDAGTPQGGSCSPLLCNIALHGLGDAVGEKLNRWQSRKTKDCKVVRYADDFLIFCYTKEQAEATLPMLKEWLKLRGLELSEEKTRIVHLSEGFDFLGFNVRLYPSKKTTKGCKLLIKPSKKSIQKIRDRIKKEWIKKQGQHVGAIIETTNPIIRGWSNYHKTVVSKDVFRKLDKFMYEREMRYAKRLHRRKPIKWRLDKYWGKLNLDRNDHWVFGDKKKPLHIIKFSWTPIRRHILVKGDASPDNPELKQYWKERLKKKANDLVPSRQKIAKRQDYLCPICKTTLFNDEELHVHHVIPKKDGGKDTYQNLRLLHIDCHLQVHSQVYRKMQATSNETTLR